MFDESKERVLHLQHAPSLRSSQLLSMLGANIDQLEIAKDAEPVASTAIEAYRHALNVLADHLNAQATREGSSSSLDHP